jgi:NDP-sugar pyrophosphorylase family protein
MIDNNIQLIIPMSGIGKRFIDAGYDTPKPLIKVDGFPIIQHIVNLFSNTDDITFICNENHIKETNMWETLNTISPKAKIISISRENLRGPVDAVSKIFNDIDDEREVIISYCDYGTYWDYKKFLEETRKNNSDGAIVCYTGFHPHMLGSDNYAFVKETNGIAEEVQEKKPFTNNKMNELASNGTYYFKSGKILKKYFLHLLSTDQHINNEFYVSVVYNKMISDGLKITTFLIDNMLQWGTPYDLEIYNGWSNYFSNLMVTQPKIENPPNTTLILPMAGKGSRFSEEGYNLPKPLLDIDGSPMIIKAVECLPKSDNNIFICLKEHITEYNIDQELKKVYNNCNVISIDDVTQGQACTCEIGIDKTKLDLENPILISACDNGVYYDSEEYLRLLNDESIDIIVWTFRNNQSSKVNPNAYAWLDVDENNLIKHVSCKKFIYDDPLKTHAIIGTMFFRKGKYFIEGLQKNYNENIRTNGEFYVDDVLNQNIKLGLKVKVFEVKNYICWGTPNDYKTYNYWKEFFNKCNWHIYNNITNKIF